MKENFEKNYPFISCIAANNKEYVGIILNYDNQVVSIYDLAMIIDPVLKEKFLELGEIWWWESNRRIPINIFLKNDCIKFKPFIKTFNSKDIQLLFGPMTTLNDLIEKRIKRKSIQLVRSVKNTRNL